MESTAPSQTSSQSAILQVISLNKLMSDTASIASELLTACTDTGFLYLDCTNWNGTSSMTQIQQLFQTSKTLYDLPWEEKNAWAADHNHGEDMIVGYKEAGMGSGPVDGMKDGFEGFMVSRNSYRYNKYRSFGNCTLISFLSRFLSIL